MRRIRPPFPAPGRPDLSGEPPWRPAPARRDQPSLGVLLTFVAVAALFAFSGEPPPPLAAHPASAEAGVPERTSEPPDRGPGPEVLPATDRYGRGPEYWRKRVLEARERVAEARERFEAARQAYRDARQRNYPRGEAVEKIERELQAAREALKQARADLEALPEEARRAGALPGWLRVEEVPADAE